MAKWVFIITVKYPTMYNNSPAQLALTQNKRKILEVVERQLKDEFIGLDEIITRILQLITPWFLFPEVQQRPVIINLWGMTGVGKTSLVKRLVELIQFNERFYHFDMGNNSDKVDTLKTFFKSLCKNKSGFPFVLALDEFQYANTKDMHGDELEKAYSRVIWELLDTGKFQVFREGYGRIDIADTVEELRFLISKRVKAENGIVIENVSYFLAVCAGSNRFNRWTEDKESEYDTDNENFKKKKLHSKRLILIKDEVVDVVFDLCSEMFAHKVELRDYLLQLDEKETLAFLEKIQSHVESRKVLDCSKALIFILGNLDEAYGFSNNVNPDINADEFHFHSRKINLLQVKSALQSRFRNEQIARLGNNHIIYPALNKTSFQRIIQLELNKISEEFFRNLEIDLVFHKRINQVLYSEGVFATQGTRPLFSTIYNLIHPRIVTLQFKVMDHFQSCKKIMVEFKRGSFWFSLFDSKNLLIHSYEETVNLFLTSIRSSKNDDLQAVTAVHESGHALASVFLMGIYPSQIFSISSDEGSEGIVTLETNERMVWSREQIFNRAAVYLAGLVAEKIIFGKENITAGSESDLKKATHLISRLVKKQGLNSFPYHIDIENSISSSAIFDHDSSFNQVTRNILDEAMVRAESCLVQNKSILLILSKYLATHSSMSKKQFKIFLKAKLSAGNSFSIPEKFSYTKRLYQTHNDIDIASMADVRSDFISSIK